MATITCEDGKVYVSITKKCTSYASEESYQILSGSSVLVTSASFADNEERTNEYCLTASTNNQYTFKMIDQYGDSWSSGSWVMISGLYGNVVFKNYMTKGSEEAVTLSLYYPIMKTQQWKTFSSTSSIASDWFAVNFSDGNWQQVTLGSASPATGTQYFRKQFASLPNMAAYELEMNYRHGIIAYMNGKEIFRDHMVEGAVTPATGSSGAFNNYEYHGVIRPAGEIEGSNNVLAIELHFPSAEENAVDFDAYMALLASSIDDENNKCYMYAYDVAVTSTAGNNVAYILDYTKQSYFNAPATLPVTVNYELSGPRAHINGLRIWPYTYVSQSPGSFVLQGAMSSSGTFTTVFSVTNAMYTSSTHQLFKGYFGAKPYQSYRFILNSSVDGSAALAAEVQPVVCHDMLPTAIEFNPASVSAYANYQQVSIQPTMNEFTGCTIQPALPAGVTLNAATCSISGRPTAALPSTVFTVSSQVEGQNYQGTFTLEVTACAGALVRILRTYQASAGYEAFSIKDQATQQVMLSVAADSGQRNGQEWSTVLCFTSARYEIDISSTLPMWQDLSYMYVQSMLSNEEYEILARIRYDTNLGLPLDRIINAQWAVSPSQAWQYKMGEVPANWQTEAGWQTASVGSFPASSNTIQLYKNTFTVASLDDVSGFSISLRYLYGCIIYMNNVEVFRNGVTGDLTASSTSTHAYTDLLYRQITLPVKTFAVGDQPAVSYIQQGSNTIAIAIVAQIASQTTSVFDCAVRLVLSGSRVFDYTLSSDELSGNPFYALNHYGYYELSGESCTNHLDVTFKNDRREWLSAVTVFLYYTQGDMQVTGFTMKARNNNLEEWTTLKTVEGMSWSLVGEHKRIWLGSSTPYNQYRFENFNAGALCEWRFGTLDLSMEAAPANIPELSYSTPLVINKAIEMGELYPNSDYYFDFTVSPALPNGITIDSATGKISGTTYTEMPATSYQITAKKVGGGSSTATLTISVEVCTGSKSLITLVARMDAWPAEGSYMLFSGKGTTGQVVSSNTAFRVSNGLNYGDFCVPHGLYTLQLKDSKSDGWANPAGYYLTVDLGTMIVEMGQIPPSVASVTTSFSSLLPFQIEYSDWKIFNAESDAPANWNAVDFDDSTWQSVKVTGMGNHNGVTAYIRHDVEVPSLEDYHVLNVRMKYTGGVVVYFNGRTVARFNLADEFDKNTEALTAHDAYAFSKFHVVLPTVGAVAGKNVMAFEGHRATGQSVIVFDATGVFGVNDCSIVVDTFSAIDASAVTGCEKENLLDLNPATYGSLPNEAGAFLAWTVENLEGSKFNFFGMQSYTARTGYGFSVYARWEESEEYTSVLALTNQAVKDRERNTWAIPAGIAGFKQFKFEVDSVSNDVVGVSSYELLYCKPSGSGACPAVGDYPAVGEGQISPSTCPEGFRGYSYRECSGGQLGEAKTDKCEYKLPARLNYETNNMEFVLGTQANSGAPTYRNIITEFYMQEDTPLPAGLSINPTTGEISGKPTQAVETLALTVRGKNPKGETFVAITISVRKGFCQPEGVFERTPVGEVAVYQCSKQGSYVGTQTRACVLGETNGEWQKASGFCMPVMTIVLIVVVVIVIIAVVVFLIMRRTRSAKAVGGVKGGKVAKKTVKKDVKTKTVKV